MVVDVDPCTHFVGNVLEDVIPATSSNEYECTETDIMPNNYQLISTYLDIRAFCHVNLMDAKIRISHDDLSGTIVSELRSGSKVILRTKARLDFLKSRIVIKATSYGVVEPRTCISTHLSDGSHCHFHLHIFHDYYAFELNGQEVLRFSHRLPFQVVDPNEVYTHMSIINRSNSNVNTNAQKDQTVSCS